MNVNDEYMKMPFNSLVELDDGDPGVALAIGARLISGEVAAVKREKGRSFLRYVAKSGNASQKKEAVALLGEKEVGSTAAYSDIPVSMLLSKANLSDRAAVAEIFRRYFNDRERYKDVIRDVVGIAVKMPFCGGRVAYSLGVFYEENGEFSKALRWYRNAADCKDGADALNKLVCVWKNGAFESSSVKVAEPDAEKAAMCQMRIAENGNARDAAKIAESIFDKKKGFEKYLADSADEWLMKGVLRFGDSAGVPLSGEKPDDDTVDFIVENRGSDPEAALALLDVACRRVDYPVESNLDLERFFISNNRTEYCYPLAQALIELDEEANRGEIISLMEKTQGEHRREAIEYCAEQAIRSGNNRDFVKYYSEIENSPEIPPLEFLRMAVKVFAADEALADYDRAFSALDELEKYGGDAEDILEECPEFRRFCELQYRCARYKNDDSALFELGDIYYSGINVPSNRKLAVDKFIFPAALLKNKDAVCFLIDKRTKYFDFSRKDDYKTILRYAAELRVPEAALGEADNCMKKGDYDAALKYYEIAMPIDRETCALGMASIYCDADYPGRDIVKGVRLLLAEVKNGSRRAAADIDSYGLREIADEISRADSGSAAAQNELGHRLFEGAGVERNIGQAVAYLEKASAVIPEAAEFLAEYYLSERDMDSCEKYLRRVRELGSGKYKTIRNLNLYKAEKLIASGNVSSVYSMAKKLLSGGRGLDKARVADKVSRLSGRDTAAALYRLCDWLRLNDDTDGKKKIDAKGFGLCVCAAMRDEGKFVEADYELVWDYFVAGREIGYAECREMLYAPMLEEFGKRLGRIRNGTAKAGDYRELAQIYSERKKGGRESERVREYREKADAMK